MEERYDFYNGTPPHQAHSDTSRAAADHAVTNAEKVRIRVHRYIVKQGKKGATDGEIQQALSILLQTEVPKRRELVLAEKVADSGVRRLSPAGRPATVWVARKYMPMGWLPPRQMGDPFRVACEEIRSLLNRYNKSGMIPPDGTEKISSPIYKILRRAGVKGIK